MPRILLFLSLLGITSAVAPGFTVGREASNPNSLTLRCVDPEDNTLSNPVFFRDGEQFVLVGSQTVAEGVRWEVTRNREGSFQCAATLEGERSATRVIVALPFGANAIPSVNVQREFRFRDGETAIIDCPIPPGNHGENYFVRWQSDEENPTVFYSFSFANIPRMTRSSSRYSVAPGNFSLMISDVNPGDERFHYRCFLGVERDLLQPTGRDVYETAGNVDLSLIVAKRPEFSQQPTSQVAIADDTISFTCSVLSSPEPSTFTWEAPVIAEGGTFNIQDMDPEQNSDLEVGGMISTGVLRIPNVEGRDSGLVKCWATQESEMLGTQVVVANATLSVLDAVTVIVDQLQDCGLILTVTLKRNLMDPVSLNILFTDTRTFRTDTITTDTQYSNVVVINHVVRKDRIEFGAFTLSVALENGRDNVGPRTKVPGIYYRCPPLSTVSISLIAVSSFLFLLVFILCTCSGYIMFICYRYGKNGQRAIMRSLCCGMMWRCCKCGRDEENQPAVVVAGAVEDGDEFMVAGLGPVDRGPPRSQNGFSSSTAKKYACGVGMSAKFGLEDDLIKHHIRKYLQDHTDVQQLWNSVATAEATDLADRVPSDACVARVHFTVEEKPEDFDAVVDNRNGTAH